ncbi:hypothetical protein ACFFRR_000829 [Megaselia abdita]
MQILSEFIEMGVSHAWIVLSPSISTDLDDDQSDSVSVISESDRDENADSPSSSKYFWDNTHISLSNENSTEEQIVPESKIEDIFEELIDNEEEENDDKEKVFNFYTMKKLANPSIWIAIIIISNLCIYTNLKEKHSVSFGKLQISESQNRDLRLEINTLRKIIFLMNVDENLPHASTAESFEEGDIMTRSKDVKIYEDDYNKKFICIGVKKFIDLL